MIIGLVGGVASGKSLAAEFLRKLGAKLIDADRVGHEVLTEPAVRAALVERWGEAILGADGRVDRPAIARRVFGASDEAAQELKFLESVTHPRIAARIRSQVDAWTAEDPRTVVALDAALLLKAGWVAWCDQVLFVDTPLERRLEQARRRGWNPAEFAAREAAQESLEMKRKAATWTIDNGGSPDDLARQIERFWQAAVEPAMQAPAARRSARDASDRPRIDRPLDP